MRVKTLKKDANAETSMFIDVWGAPAVLLPIFKASGRMCKSGLGPPNLTVSLGKEHVTC